MFFFFFIFYFAGFNLMYYLDPYNIYMFGIFLIIYGTIKLSSQLILTVLIRRVKLALHKSSEIYY